MIDKNTYLSIIVPVYNVEKYLRACVDSILCQSFRDYELILVDDGSPDGSPAICDEYASQDPRVRVIHQENGGLSDARNSGMSAATGIYLLFIDSDDFIAEGSLERIFSQVKIDGECDVTFLNAVGVLSDGSYREFAFTYQKNMLYQKSRKEVLEYFVKLSQFPVSACIKLIRRQFVVDHHICFTKGIVCEDLDHMLELILGANTFNCIDVPYYNYRCFRENSISSSNRDRLFYDLLYIINKWYELSNNKYYKNSAVIQQILAYEYCPLLWYYHYLSKSEKAAYKSEMKKYSVVMQTSKDKRVILTNAVYHLAGILLVSQLLHMYYSTKLKVKG